MATEDIENIRDGIRRYHLRVDDVSIEADETWHVRPSESQSVEDIEVNGELIVDGDLYVFGKVTGGGKIKGSGTVH